MIPITLQPEPHEFDRNVRKRGQSFLAINPSPTSDQFKPHHYWKWAATELYEAYRRICAYSCTYIPTPKGCSVDHFLPKSKRPDQAYEWQNFRLSLHRLNVYKGDADIIDPFSVQPGWFVLDFPSCLVKPGDGLPGDLKQQIEHTIKTLKLNDDDSLVQDRCDIMVMFAKEEVALPFLEKRYPFLAEEVIRQGIQNTASQLFKLPS